MKQSMEKTYDNKTFDFEWGDSHLTFVQLIDGSKAAYCQEEDQYYWLYFAKEDTEYQDPLYMLAMSQSEEDELEYDEIIKDVAAANAHGMTPQVSDFVRTLLIERNVRRQTVFLLNTMDASLISQEKGIVYKISRRAIALLQEDMIAEDAVSMAIQEYYAKTKK